VATYSPAHYDPADVQEETAAGYSPSGGPAYSPSAPYYSPAQSSPGYSPSTSGGGGLGAPSSSSPQQNYYSPHTPSYSPTQGPVYSPGNATPATSQMSSNDSPPVAAVAAAASITPAGYSPSIIQGSEVSGNTTPHPGASGSPLSSPGPRYSWSGGGRNTPPAAGSQPVVNGGPALEVHSTGSSSPGPSVDNNNVVSAAAEPAGEIVETLSPPPADEPAADSPLSSSLG
jgi:DNA-directed RNA polymerase II subunit RPB1